MRIGLPCVGRRAWILFGLLLGTTLGVGAFTIVYAEGASYLSSDPTSCVHCHIMRPQFDGWQKASHHAAATCVDCHLPASGLAKWWAKGVNGFQHSKAFTLQAFPEPIQITPRNAAILQDNCVRCHADLVHDLAAGAGPDEGAPRCTHCHDAVGHGPPAGLGGADRGLARELDHAEEGR